MTPWFGRPITIIVLSILILVGDFFTGPFIHFPLAFVLPVGLMAWWHSQLSASLLATALIVIRSSYTILWMSAIQRITFYTGVNSLVRLVVLLIIAYLVARMAKQQRLLHEEVTKLKGLLPICSYCKKIRTDEGIWEQLEAYISEHSDATFSHGICPECTAQQISLLRARRSEQNYHRTQITLQTD